MALSGRRQNRAVSVGDTEIQKDISAYAPAAQAMQAVEVVKEASEAEAKVQLYDMIDHTWTRPLNQRAAETFHLRKVVYTCSACQWTSTWEPQFKEHLKQVQSQRRMHAKADMLPSPTPNGLAYLCTGCSSAFSVPARVQMHVDSVMRQTAGHENATLVLARRFALEAPVTTMNGASPLRVVAVASQSERTVVPHKRSGRHRRHHRSAHGN